MKRRLFTLMLLVITALTPTLIRAQTADRAKSPEAVLLPAGLSLKSCGLRSLLPGVFFECDPCCNVSDVVYVNCRNGVYGNKSECECITAAYNACLDSGCGPCQCCADWAVSGKNHGCINDEKEWRNKKAATPNAKTGQGVRF